METPMEIKWALPPIPVPSLPLHQTRHFVPFVLGQRPQQLRELLLPARAPALRAPSCGKKHSEGVRVVETTVSGLFRG